MTVIMMEVKIMTKGKSANVKKLMLASVAILLSGSMFATTASGAFAAMVDSDGKFYSEYSSAEETFEASADINLQLAEESIVLLKNKDNALPLLGVRDISVFGKCASNYYYQGGGSGVSSSFTNDDYVSLYSSLEQAGYKINPSLKKFYENDGNSYKAQQGGGPNYGAQDAPKETDVEEFTAAVEQSYARYSDAALIVLGRTGSEGGDLGAGNYTLNADGTYTENERHSLKLTEDEQKLIEYVTNNSNFDKVIIVLNNPIQFEYGWIDDASYLYESIANGGQGYKASKYGKINSDKIVGALWCGHPGLNGTIAIGEALNGSINPSGRLADTYAKNFVNDPTFYNEGKNDQWENGTINYTYVENGAKVNYHAIEYEEDIYYGYRYYETRYATMLQTDYGTAEATKGKAVTYSTDADVVAKAEEWYDNNVTYPYGYGLSYTEFEYSNAKFEYDEANAVYNVSVTVTNTGDYAGKDVVELYYTAPYYYGGVAKSYVELGDFAKTDILKPGQSQTLTMQLYEQDMASFDWNNASGLGAGYVLEKGDYTLKLQANSHDVLEGANGQLTKTFTYAEGTFYEKDRITGETVEVRFSNKDEFDSLNRVEGSNEMGMTGDMTLLSRDDWEGTWPTTPVVDMDKDGKAGTAIAFDDTDYKNLKTRQMLKLGSTEEEKDKAWYDYFYGLIQEAEQNKWTQNAAVTVMFSDLVGEPLFDANGKVSEKWTKFMNQWTYEELTTQVFSGGYSTSAVERMGVPATTHVDGPTALKTTMGYQWVATTNIAVTWNKELCYKQGLAIGNEALQSNTQGWYAPGLNLHRTPFGGRNFEYYGEDGVQVGKIAAEVVKGCQSKGIVAFVKHFAVNNQDSFRGNSNGSNEQCEAGLFSYLTEQNMRENYFKAFQICIEEGGAMGMMVSMNCIGNVGLVNNYQAVNGVVRQEWGMYGDITTDIFYQADEEDNTIYSNLNLCLRAGLADTLLDGTATMSRNVWSAEKNTVLVDGTKENDISWISARMDAMYAMYAMVNSNVTKNGADLSGFVDKELEDATIGMSYEAEIKLASEEDDDDTETPAPPQTLSASLKADEQTPPTGGDQGGEQPGGPDQGGNQPGGPGGGDKPSGGGDSGKPGGGGFPGKDDGGEAITDGRYYTVVSGALPEGMTLSEGGKISGTCYRAGTYTFTVELRQDGWVTAQATFTIEVVNDLFEFTDDGVVCTDENAATVTYSLAEGSSLPAGLTLNADGTITGTAAAGTYEYTVAAELDGQTYYVTGSVTVKDDGGSVTPTPGGDEDQGGNQGGNEDKDDSGCGSAVNGLVGVAIAVPAIVAAAAVMRKKRNN